jgi:hypothetical protein
MALKIREIAPRKADNAYRRSWVGEFHDDAGNHLGMLVKIGDKYRVLNVECGIIKGESRELCVAEIESAGSLQVSAGKRVRFFRLKQAETA